MPSVSWISQTQTSPASSRFMIRSRVVSASALNSASSSVRELFLAVIYIRLDKYTMPRHIRIREYIPALVQTFRAAVHPRSADLQVCRKEGYMPTGNTNDVLDAVRE